MHILVNSLYIISLVVKMAMSYSGTATNNRVSYILGTRVICSRQSVRASTRRIEFVQAMYPTLPPRMLTLMWHEVFGQGGAWAVRLDVD